MATFYIPFSCDAVILTALPIEHQAVLAQMDEVREIVHPLGTVYQQGTFPGKRRTLTIVTTEVGIGGVSAAAETERALSFFHPRIALFVGIAGGLKKVQLGDVVIGTKIYNYESGTAASYFRPVPEVWRTSYALEQRAKAEARKQDWLYRLNDYNSSSPRAFVGAIAVGEKLVSSKHSSTYRLLRTYYKDALAVEMEGHGFLSAARLDETISSLIIRGISDLIDNKRDVEKHESKRTAANNATTFAFHILSLYEFPLEREYHDMIRHLDHATPNVL